VIAIEDEGLNKLVLMHIVEMIDKGQYSTLIANGVPADSIDCLRQLQGPALMKLAKLSKKSIRLTVDPSSFEIAIKAATKMAFDESMFEYFVTNGASIPMLRALFKVERERIDHAQATLARTRPVGRPAMPPADVRAIITEKWNKIGTQSSPRAKYYAIHKMFSEIPLSVLYAVVNEHEKR
jgi:Protein of unknown function (DUF2857)